MLKGRDRSVRELLPKAQLGSLLVSDGWSCDAVPDGVVEASLVSLPTMAVSLESDENASMLPVVKLRRPSLSVEECQGKGSQPLRITSQIA